MALNLNILDNACTGCIKSYAGKHRLKAGDKFSIKCGGIPKTYVKDSTAMTLSSEGTISATALLDPVTWAKEMLDWHCLDPDHSIWKRKNPMEQAKQTEDNPGRQSKYHRPYQATMLRCSATRKVFRIGRQAGKSETLIISIIFNLFTNSGFKVILITPFQAQIEMIFTRIKDLINSNPGLANSIKRAVSAPQYTLELHNGSYIKGFTAGTRSGGNADSVRGQTANMLVFDEADYLAPGDMDSALAVITNNPDATVWMSSTPTGKREKFYNACMDKLWKEFHYSSSVNPNWGPDLESFFRSIYTDIGYQHEVLAEFGSQEQGVFQVGYVEAAESEYKYGDMRPDHRWQYSIGVDWNDVKIGTTLCVTGFNPTTNSFLLVERLIVQRDGWTQLAACEKIAELNRKWRPFAIYVDKGFGGTQYEVLRKFGFDARIDKERGPNSLDAKLATIVKAFDFGSSIEVRDPFSKQMIKKPAKGFLVENAVRRFETHDIYFSKFDQQLKDELLGYIIDRVSIHGQVVYGTNNDQVGDHNLDAFMLSLIGFTLEKTAFGKPSFNEKISFTNMSLNSSVDPDQHKDKKTWKELRALATPNGSGRSDLEASDSSSSGGIPAGNLREEPVESNKNLWNHPGFDTDGPKPDVSEQRKKFAMLKRTGSGTSGGRGSQMGRRSSGRKTF